MLSHYCPRMVVLPFSFIDKRIISYLRTGERLNHARNSFSRAVGLKNFRELSKLENVLIDVEAISMLYDGLEKFYFKSIIYHSCRWISPERDCSVSFCYDGNLNLFYSVLFEDFKNGGLKIPFNLDGFCIRKSEVEAITELVNHSSLCTEITEEFDLFKLIDRQNINERESLPAFWNQPGHDYIRKFLKMSKTKSHLHRSICEVADEYGSEYFQENGIAIYDLINDLSSS